MSELPFAEIHFKNNKTISTIGKIVYRNILGLVLPSLEELCMCPAELVNQVTFP